MLGLGTVCMYLVSDWLVRTLLKLMIDWQCRSEEVSLIFCRGETKKWKEQEKNKNGIFGSQKLEKKSSKL
jgi:hypothetical protein